MPRVSIDDRRRWLLAPTTGPVVVVPRQPELPVVRVYGSVAPTVVALPSQHVSEMPLVIVRQSPAASQRLTRPQAQCLPRQPQQSLGAGGTVTTGSLRPLPVVTAEGRPASQWAPSPSLVVRQSPAGSQLLTRPQGQCLPRQPQQSLGVGGTVTTAGEPRPLPVATADGRPVSQWEPSPSPVVVVRARSQPPVTVVPPCAQRTPDPPEVSAGPTPAVDLTRRTKRKSIGSDFESHAALEAAKQEREVEELIALMPPAVARALLGGAPGAQQVSDPEDRAKTLYDAVALKAGSDGSSLSNARRAWVAFREYATSLDLPDSGLPAKPALVASFLRSEATRAASGAGAQGGTTVANSRRVGLLWLYEKLGFPIDVDNIVALGAANPGQLRAYRRADPTSRKRKQAGSLPIAAYAQMETLAADANESPKRFFARSLVAFSLLQSVRAVDALRSVEDADDQDSDRVMSAYSYASKDGEPIKTFAPARGFLGDLTWWPEHRDAVRAAGQVFPKWTQPYGSKGCVTKATPGPPLRAVMPKAHLVASIKACLQFPPLSLSDEAFDDLGITAHSEHGSPSDMLTIIGPHSHFGSFLREDVREIGHWLRLGALEADHEDGRAGAQGRRRGAPPGRQATGAFANSAAEMAAAYCQGDGRHGRRTAQLRVRNRWISAVRSALAQRGGHWTTLPAGRGDYEILQADPPQAP